MQMRTGVINQGRGLSVSTSVLLRNPAPPCAAQTPGPAGLPRPPALRKGVARHREMLIYILQPQLQRRRTWHLPRELSDPIPLMARAARGRGCRETKAPAGAGGQAGGWAAL